MKVILLNGSPNEHGCTYTALSEVAHELSREGIDTKMLWIGAKPVPGCMDCGKCRGVGKCVIDDAVNSLLEECKTADGFVVGSPVYFSSPNGSLISLLDRLFHTGKMPMHIPAAAVVSARRAGTTASLDVLYKYFLIHEMPVVPSSYWCMVHGYTPEDVKRDLEGLQTMRNIAKNMAWMMRSIEAGRKAGLEEPVSESGNVTNFIQ